MHLLTLRSTPHITGTRVGHSEGFDPKFCLEGGAFDTEGHCISIGNVQSEIPYLAHLENCE